MQDQRPMFLNLFQIKFPVTAIISILHRVSGVFLFLGLPWILYLWHASLASSADFSHVVDVSLSGGGALLLWLWLSALIYHLFAGLRHLVMDLGFAEELATARITAYVVLVAFMIASVVVGIWLW